jgi:hypothetical protein
LYPFSPLQTIFLKKEPGILIEMAGSKPEDGMSKTSLDYLTVQENRTSSKNEEATSQEHRCHLERVH